MRVIRPLEGDAGRTIVYLHGGGYIWMSARTPLAVGLVRASGARCVSVDYRRAPEHPYPAAVDDVVAVYRALLADGEPTTTCRARYSAGGDGCLGGAAWCRYAVADAAVYHLRRGRTLLSSRERRLPPTTRSAMSGRLADDGRVVSRRSGPYVSDSVTALCGSARATAAAGAGRNARGAPRRRSTTCRAEEAGQGVDATIVGDSTTVHMWVVFGPDIPSRWAAFRAAAGFEHASGSRPCRVHPSGSWVPRSGNTET